MPFVDEIDRLLEEWHQLEFLVSSLQRPVTEPSTLSLARSTYTKWLYEGLALLPEYFKAQFWQPYEGVQQLGIGLGNTIVGIKTFLTDPLAMRKRADLASFVTGRGSFPEDFVWSYPYEHYFSTQFKAQRQVLLEAREWQLAQTRMRQSVQVEAPQIESLNLHPEIVKVAKDRYAAGQYDDAVAYSIVAVNEAVRAKSGSEADDGVALMQRSFSPKKPMLRLSERADEQKAFMDLFAASWSAFRNPRAHTTKVNTANAHSALELLAFASALMRLVDESVKVNWGDSNKS